MMASASDSTRQLSIALDWNVDPICIEIDLASTSVGCIRSSNSTSFLAISESEVNALTKFLKALLPLEPRSGEGASGPVDILGRKFLLNVCPQVDGEILILHRLDPSQNLATTSSTTWKVRPPCFVRLDHVAPVPGSAEPSNESGHFKGLVQRLLRKIRGSGGA
jgi:hypothetical protein